MALVDKLIELVAAMSPIPAQEIAATMSLHHDLALSSLEIVSFVVSLEKEFGVVLRDKGISATTTIADLSAFIEAGRGAARS